MTKQGFFLFFLFSNLKPNGHCGPPPRPLRAPYDDNFTAPIAAAASTPTPPQKGVYNEAVAWISSEKNSFLEIFLR